MLSWISLQLEEASAQEVRHLPTADLAPADLAPQKLMS